MSDELTNWILITGGVAILTYKLWSLYADWRRSRSARKAYLELSEEQKREVEAGLFKSKPILAAYSKPVPVGRAIFMAVTGMLLAALAVYLKFKFTGR